MKTILIAAVTLDGKISRDAEENVTWTSPQDKKFFRDKTLEAGVVIMGSHTYQAIGKPLPGRLNIVLTANPAKFQDKTKLNLLEFTADAPQKILDNLAKRGFASAVIGGGRGIYTLFLREKLVNELYLTVSPMLFGVGVSLIEATKIPEANLKLLEFKKLGADEILLHYQINY
ncbi:MAG: hypothetical protein A2445_05120 [Candidatus Jacksonbacteria bacterium RIFOXYC2_FULL_44_29]|nr:MAG: FolA [Parcubacteria group bacterium GW2011_GWC2_44_22]OGY75726.1 MAG: hypothetical protein A2240_06265 [Candidatus Jacksonbacteria bacterium RIFOXYA2_FULL_43_12]OGY76292.1 MAG: hypothetical protein A2295_00750 [Candidatus Jacksonbacteria bacterium RIFOXYB2_FULL_44_15]OGY78118.1 MAG: hypothetical protein A2445_05120 [Candidatus Jacksonbacteria bacterium RIFOXYC2_FULL_44_29]OGY80973.1 MAG: hypothetical protein A2550_02925 [Candidatus Jacksonbacteria bacterium RIFOXYD2_FULL_43_21]HBH46751